MKKKIFWTGGWDSTFRILQLLEKNIFIQPYYMVSTRSSTAMEIRTIGILKQMIAEKFPEWSGFLGELELFDIAEIEKNDEISQAYYNLTQVGHLGNQYELLASFAFKRKLEEIELAVHKDDKVNIYIKSAVIPYNESLVLDMNSSNKEIQTLFRYFSFPILDYTKLQMEKEAKAKGWIDIMDNTWFCHRPQKGQPCGLCNPCRYTFEEGLERRFSSYAKFRYRFRAGYDLLRTVIKGTKGMLHSYKN